MWQLIINYVLYKWVRGQKMKLTIIINAKLTATWISLNNIQVFSPFWKLIN